MTGFKTVAAMVKAMDESLGITVPVALHLDHGTYELSLIHIYAFPFTDWGELWGIADRTNYDLSRHQEASGKSREYFDPETNEHYIPYVLSLIHI